MERRFKIGRVSFQVPELTRLPFLFRPIPRRIEGITMRVQMRIRKALHRSRCEVNELRPNHVARYPVLVRPFRPHPRFNFRLDLPHRLVHRMLERLQNALIEIFPHPFLDGLGQVIWLDGFFLPLS